MKQFAESCPLVFMMALELGLLGAASGFALWWLR